HVHSQYSLLDGLSRIDKLVEQAKEMGMPAIALTDHGALYGIVEFYVAAKKQGIKPILGMEAYLAPRTIHDRDPKLDKASRHLLLLAINETGWKNLMRLATIAQLEGYYYKPRIDREILAQYADGLIATTGCLSGDVPVAIKQGDLDQARKYLDWYYEVFGPDRFFFELQSHNIPELEEVNRTLLELGKRYNARFLATNDVHYIAQEDAQVQEVLIAIHTGKKLSDKNRLRMHDPTYYLRSPEEMRQLFGEIPGALENTLLIAEMANVELHVNSLAQVHRYLLPHFPVPEGFNTQTYLRYLVERGLRERYGDRADSAEIRERMEYELQVIHQMGFDAYFLIVWDLVNYAREQGIWYNARGSAAGSLVAYALGITRVDPLKFDLIFERFLNPDRQSMPDIDIDFQDDRRYEMLQYVQRKYGEDHVAQIITYGTLKARAALRDVGRVMDIDRNKVDRLAKLIPNVPSRPVTLEEVLKGRKKKEENEEYGVPVPEVVEWYKRDPEVKKLIDTAIKIEGAVRNLGTHAAGVVITPSPLVEHIPLNRPTGDAQDTPIKAVTQFEMGVLEDMGLLKVDFLGLATLSVMARACQLIEQRHGIKYDMDTLPTNDPKALELLGRGETAGVFQVEGQGFTRYLVKMKPQRLEDIVAMVALYRPGPMRFIDVYIRRMHGQEEVTYRHPDLEPILKETYGITVYQEQVMRAAMVLAGYTGAEADFLRKAISKKKEKELAKHHVKFVEGAVARGIDRELAEQIFEDWRQFAHYGFNKSHAAAYAKVAMQTAFLKAHYPLEYMTALLTVFLNKSDKIAHYVSEARRMGLIILPPDVNHSEWEFVIERIDEEKEGIRFGLGAIKNASRNGVEEILRARREGGPFQDINDFIQRVDLRKVGKRTLEVLIKVGALDRFGDRAALLASMDRMVALSAKHFKDRAAGQLSLFGDLQQTGPTVHETFTFVMPEREVSLREKLAWERELTGVFLSEHPLAPFFDLLPKIVTHFAPDLEEARHGQTVRVAGVLVEVRPHRTRKGDPMAFATLDDSRGTIPLVIFPRAWREYKDLLQEGRIVVVTGKVDADEPPPKILVDQVTNKVEVPKELVTAPEPGSNIGLRYTAPPIEARPVAEATSGRPVARGGHASRRANGGNGARRPSLSRTEPRVDAPSLVLYLHPQDEPEKEARRMQALLRVLRAHPGPSPVRFIVHLEGRRYQVDFPNQTIQVDDALLEQLQRYLHPHLGERWARV
ncbi:MAG: DNA polymerase III subunit alpha, partial [Chloroflexi bacterium]|nr:DNA polymerase III subunit alpha [Chloroflexota bacterium]